MSTGVIVPRKARTATRGQWQLIKRYCDGAVYRAPGGIYRYVGADLSLRARSLKTLYARLGAARKHCAR